MSKIKKEYKLIANGFVEIGIAENIEDLAKLIGCSRAHIYKYIDKNNEFTYKKTHYQIK